MVTLYIYYGILWKVMFDLIICGIDYILIVLSVFMVYVVLRLWYSVVVCSSVCGRRKCLFDITFFLQTPRGEV